MQLQIARDSNTSNKKNLIFYEPCLIPVEKRVNHSRSRIWKICLSNCNQPFSSQIIKNLARFYNHQTKHENSCVHYIHEHSKTSFRNNNARNSVDWYTSHCYSKSTCHLLAIPSMWFIELSSRGQVHIKTLVYQQNTIATCWFCT